MTDARATQGKVVALMGVAAEARATQTNVVALVGVGSDARATHTPVVALAGVIAIPRATQVQVIALVNIATPPCLTKDAECWRIERTDGTVYRFTSHDEDLPFVRNGAVETFSPCGALQSSALQLSAEYQATENLDLSGIISELGITQGDLWAGRFDGADVEVWRVPWAQTTDNPPKLLAAGKAGALTFGATGFKFEVTTAGERLAQRPILQPVMPSCRYKLGDSRCQVDLEALRVTGAVTALADNNLFTGAKQRIFTDNTRAEIAGYFALGRLTWTSGPNDGISVDVKSFSSGEFVLEQPMQYDIAVGDDYSVVPGCDRLFTTCDAKFSNSINFGGYPHLKGADDLSLTPDVKAVDG